MLTVKNRVFFYISMNLSENNVWLLIRKSKHLQDVGICKDAQLGVGQKNPNLKFNFKFTFSVILLLVSVTFSV